ncbi:enolase C-terminal domain-like protein [Paraburkholderia phosphatilytica]|uniref:enolase C-terminal domain-like protein n=1 Tax=Paraburkholderia phosphatilytica TaxID=2282883 RepID=UPI0013DF8166|nr:enolase C-terminal domain-like protein [Paraburkholderia phosphatilytica]
MQIIDIRAATIPISRYLDPSIPSGGLTTSMVAVITDVIRAGKPVVGFGFSSIGRYGQQGLIAERFTPRLLQASFDELADESGSQLDPLRAWNVMMKGEKPGGHGERCVAVGTLDMALWDLAAKLADLPLYAYPASRVPGTTPAANVSAYAGGGYYYAHDDIQQLTNEAKQARDLGYTHFKLKSGAATLERDIERIEAVSAVMRGAHHVAVNAMNSYGPGTAQRAADALAPLGVWWFEDICDPLDFSTLASVARRYDGAIAAGEALFSVAEAKLVDDHGGLRRHQDVLLFDPVHCYGLPGYLQIVNELGARGWDRERFWPHGGYLFTLHVAQALELGGTEVNPFCFQPFGGFADSTLMTEGKVSAPEAPGIGFEARQATRHAFNTLLDDQAIR